MAKKTDTEVLTDASDMLDEANGIVLVTIDEASEVDEDGNEYAVDAASLRRAVKLLDKAARKIEKVIEKVLA